MQTNSDGWIAIKKRTGLPNAELGKYLKMGDVEYFFTTKVHICMAWVRPEHANRLLEIRRTCCGSEGHRIFDYASEMDVKRWETGIGWS